MIPKLINDIKGGTKHPGFKKYLKNTGWMFFAKFASLAISFVTMAYMARYFGPENYGQVSYALSFCGIFSFLALGSVEQILFRELIKHPDKKSVYFGSAFAIRIFFSIVTIVATIGFAYFFSKDVSLILIAILSVLPLLNVFQIINYEFQATVESKYPSLVSLAVVIILSILKILVAAFNQGVIYFVLVLMLEPILYAILLIRTYKTQRGGHILHWQVDWQIVKQMIADSWPLVLVGAFSTIYARIDQVMIKNMIDTASVGIYDAAVRLSEVWYFIPTIISTSLFPAIVNAKKIEGKIFHDRVIKILWFLLAIAVVIALITTFFSGLIISIVFGSQFAGAAKILQIYIWSIISIFAMSILSNYLIAENFKKEIFFSNALAMVVNVLLNLWLIPTIGIVGAALATLIAYSLAPLTIIFSPRVFHGFLKRENTVEAEY